MKNRLGLELILTAAISLVVVVSISRGISIRYLMGFLFFVVIMVIFIVKPLYFLIGLFLFRSILDNFLMSVRIYVGGVDIGLGGIVALGLIVGTIYYIVINKNLSRLQHVIVVLYFIFCLISIVSFFISPDRIGATKALVARFSILSILSLTILNIRSKRDAHLLLKAIVLSAIIPLIIGSIKYIIEGGRFSGTFAHPNILAIYLLVIIGCVLIQLDSSQQYIVFSFWRKFYLGILFTALLLTLTRSAWASCILMVGIYVFFFSRRGIIPAICLVILVGMLPIVREHILNIFDTSPGSLRVDKISSLGWRFNVWHYLFSEAIKRPFIGYGINATSFVGRYPAMAHNDYLRLFVESGVPGLIAYFGSYFYLIIHTLRNYALFKKDSYLKKLASFFICFVPAFLLMSTTENLAGYLTVLWYIWGLVGIYFGLISLKSKNAEIRNSFEHRQ